MMKIAGSERNKKKESKRKLKAKRIEEKVVLKTALKIGKLTEESGKNNRPRVLFFNSQNECMRVSKEKGRERRTVGLIGQTLRIK